MKAYSISKVFSLITILSISTSAVALQHQDLMWALKNTGNPIAIDLNPIQTYRIQGVAGQDLHLLPPRQGQKIKVAVVDTGIDITHPDLKNFIFRNKNKCTAYEALLKCQIDSKDKDSSECREKHLQADEDVYPADCYGWSILDLGLRNAQGVVGLTPNNILGRPDFTDPSGHGTHVAGTILSVTENIELIPVQVSGIGPNQPIKPYSIDLAPSENIRGGYQTATNFSERVARGIIYAMHSGAQVINLSLGWPEDQNSEVIKEAITEAQNRGIIIVAAAGNDSTSAILRPCQYKNVICVAASRPDGALASFSNYGFGVDIAAPGVEILSTIPFLNSSVRLPGFSGYDYLSGTSQATPYVTGVIAEMLSRGVPAAEIYPRLILGARKIQDELPIIKGPINTTGTKVNTQTAYKKFVLSGLIDMSNSIEVVKPQALILPADKEIQIIQWDRQSADLSFQFKLKNYWKNLENKKVSISIRSTVQSDIEPLVVKTEIMNNSSSVWATDEERTVQVNLKIKDNPIPSLSRFPRELSYQVTVMLNGKEHRQFQVKAEVISLFNKELQDPDITTYPINGQIGQQTLTPVDEVYDQDQQVKDYFLLGSDPMNKKSFTIALLKMNQGQYEVNPSQTIQFNGDISLWRPKYKIRMDIDQDGKSEYIFGVIEYLDKNLGISGPWRNHFYIFDTNMKLKQTVLFDDQRLALPYNFFWMKVGNSMRPAWVSKGPEIKKKWNARDLWGVEVFKNVKTPVDLRFYYLDEDFKLAHSDQIKDSRIVDIIQPTLAQIKAGVLPVLIAKNLGTPNKPSYVNDFSLGEMFNGQLKNERKLNALNSNLLYRNLIDTFADKAFNLTTSATEFNGMMWSSKDSNEQQRVTLLDLEQSKIFDKLISSQREVFDSALQVRGGFQSSDRRGVFLITNSELEYHDLITDQVASRSLNRFSFIGDIVFVELHTPITILDRLSNNKKLPALYTTEGSGVNRGIKMMLPLYEANGQINKFISPARLSFKAAKGCRSLGTPLFMGESSGYALDYYCGDQIKRLLLKY